VEYTAAVLEKITIDGQMYTLTWSHPLTDLDGGFDIFIDGRDTNRTYRTTELSAVVGPLDTSEQHCFIIQARYFQAGEFTHSQAMCVDGQEPANRAPTISGTPSTVAEAGQPWKFVPAATDPDGDMLSFSIANKPSWATFDAATGRLSGTPSDARRHEGITITVSDGQASVRLGPFAIEVRPAPTSTGAVTLSWDAPTRRTDGTQLENLSGYRLYKGPNANAMTLVASFDNPGLATFVVEGLAAGEWTFAITAIDGHGQESRFSNLITTNVD
jgi:hypothetical protein